MPGLIACNPCRQRHDHVAVGDQFARQLVVAGQYADLARLAAVGQDFVDPAQADARLGDEDMFLREKRVQRQFTVSLDQCGMILADQTRHAVAPELVLVEVGGQLAEPVDQEIRLAALDLVDGVAAGAEDIERDVRRLALQHAHHMRHQHRRRVVRDQHREQPFRGRGLEGAVRRDRGFELRQRIAHGPLQLEGAIGGLHAARGTYEYRIAQQLAQPSQCVAHRRLADVHRERGLGHAALAQ